MILSTLSGIAEARGVWRLGASARAFQAAPSGLTAFSLAGNVVGVIGPDKFVNALIRYAGHLVTRSAELDAEAAEEIVRLARERAPRRTGLLAEGIEAHQVDGSWVVTASAQAYGNTADYALFVEFGTAPGHRGRRVASADYYAGPYAGRRGSLNEATGRRRRVADARRRAYREHPGTESQPYFVPSYREALERRGIALAALGDEAATREDLT